MTTEFEEHSRRIEKLLNSNPIIAAGNEFVNLYELNNRSAERYIRNNLRGNYLNEDTGDVIRITRKGAEKVTRHDAENIEHLKSIALIPVLIRKSVLIAEELNEKDKNDYDSFRYYVVGVRLGDSDYTVKIVVGVKSNYYTYYDHAITPMEIKNLLKGIDEIKRPFASKEISNVEGGTSTSFSWCKDKRLISILQGNTDIF